VGIYLACALLTLIAFFVALLFSFFLRIIMPSWIIYAFLFGGPLLLFGAFLVVGIRRRKPGLTAAGGGGATVPVLLIALAPLMSPTGSPSAENQTQPLVSPSGKYVLTVPITRSQKDIGPIGFGWPYWHVTIADQDGNILYADEEESFAGQFSVYWIWDDHDRAWLYNSDDGRVFFWRLSDGAWVKEKWGHGKSAEGNHGFAPPEALYPDYVKD
jgi:hypothetical protein